MQMVLYSRRVALQTVSLQDTKPIDEIRQHKTHSLNEV